MGYYFKVFYTKYGKKHSMIVRSSSSVAAANVVLKQLTTSFNLLGEIEVYYIRKLVK